MPRVIAQQTVAKLQPIITAIDDELAKDQDERIDFHIETPTPTTLKNHLEQYKCDYRQDWKQRFQMFNYKNSKRLEFKFNFRANNVYKIIKPGQAEDLEVVKDTPVMGADGVPLELNDIEVAGYILQGHQKIVVLLSCLSLKTQSWCKDPLNNESTALISLCIRLSYKITLLTERVRFEYGA